MRDAMRDAIRFFASLIASLKLRDAKFLADRIPRANFRDATEGCDPIASLIMHSLNMDAYISQMSLLMECTSIHTLTYVTNSPPRKRPLMI